MRIKLTANRQTGANGVRAHPLAKCICGSESQGPAPRRSAAIIGAATQLLLVRYAAIIGAATQRLLARLRGFYYWCCHHGGSAGRHTDLDIGALVLPPRRISRAVRLRRSAAIIGAATQLFLVLLRSYHWCCYAAIIGAATQLSLVRLRSYHWCGYAAIIMCNHSHSEFLCSFSKFFFKCFPHDHRGFYYWCCYHGGSEKYAENCKRNEDVTDSLHAMPECGGLSKTSVQQVKWRWSLARCFRRVSLYLTPR